MFKYYGAKTNVVHLYPEPRHNKIIEPFAGSARYSLRHFDRDVLIVDKYERLIKIWQYLQKCSPNDILKLPRMKYKDNVDSYNFDCEEAKDYMGCLIGFSTESPRKSATIKMEQRPNYINHLLKETARNLYKIKHWKIQCGSYEDIPNQKATWFIDPPYKKGGHVYKHNNKNIDFGDLKEFCVSREGQVIVCETEEADWLDFKPLGKHYTRSGFQKEVIWSNQDCEVQTKLF